MLRCLIDRSKEHGTLFGNMLGIGLILTFTMMVVCYITVWVTIKKVNRFHTISSL